MPSSLGLTSFCCPAGADLRHPPALYDAMTDRLAPRFAARFHPALRHDATQAWHAAARHWRPAFTGTAA